VQPASEQLGRVDQKSIAVGIILFTKLGHFVSAFIIHPCPFRSSFSYRLFDPVAPRPLTAALSRRYKDFMKTLTITDAKKNLGRWLAAAARGEDIGIVCGADIVALRKVDVESTDYAQREYGATPQQVAALEKATERRYRRLKRGKKLNTTTAEELREMLE
jgi:antitoxin (DNA-binding transcriptional repressor) of toxin-antitoxin stability system